MVEDIIQVTSIYNIGASCVGICNIMVGGKEVCNAVLNIRSEDVVLCDELRDAVANIVYKVVLVSEILLQSVAKMVGYIVYSAYIKTVGASRI